ncbi:hypothetical protein CB0940_12028 [Cercospora beticola]|uniref:Uncharacterized protein n=1 Tax=Cercospora beticola TaxID=122368 RepID=A0A2G5IDF1_CERBT|nr:hypothetical protein CB0940_12028 [Cercospora beticola]PIB02887.1 hypothetical protein CB0940_12028 [Cercospora beticola]
MWTGSGQRGRRHDRQRTNTVASKEALGWASVAHRADMEALAAKALVTEGVAQLLAAAQEQYTAMEVVSVAKRAPKSTMKVQAEHVLISSTSTTSMTMAAHRLDQPGGKAMSRRNEQHQRKQQPLRSPKNQRSTSSISGMSRPRQSQRRRMVQQARRPFWHHHRLSPLSQQTMTMISTTSNLPLQLLPLHPRRLCRAFLHRTTVLSLLPLRLPPHSTRSRLRNQAARTRLSATSFRLRLHHQAARRPRSVASLLPSPQAISPLDRITFNQCRLRANPLVALSARKSSRLEQVKLAQSLRPSREVVMLLLVCWEALDSKARGLRRRVQPLQTWRSRKLRLVCMEPMRQLLLLRQLLLNQSPVLAVAGWTISWVR